MNVMQLLIEIARITKAGWWPQFVSTDASFTAPCWLKGYCHEMNILYLIFFLLTSCCSFCLVQTSTLLPSTHCDYNVVGRIHFCRPTQKLALGWFSKQGKTMGSSTALSC